MRNLVVQAKFQTWSLLSTQQEITVIEPDPNSWDCKTHVVELINIYGANSVQPVQLGHELGIGLTWRFFLFISL